MRDQGGIIGGFVKADASFVLMEGLLQAQLDDRISQMLKVETLLPPF